LETEKSSIEVDNRKRIDLPRRDEAIGQGAISPTGPDNPRRPKLAAGRDSQSGIYAIRERTHAATEHALLDYLTEVGGAAVAQRFKNGVAFDSFFNLEWRDLKPEERRERCAMKPVWWAGPTRNTRDLATSFFPNCSMNGWTRWGWTHLGFSGIRMLRVTPPATISC
jgi:hypothetical protein